MLKKPIIKKSPKFHNKKQAKFPTQNPNPEEKGKKIKKKTIKNANKVIFCCFHLQLQ